MKSNLSRRKNNSFISNQDLIEGMRNNSFRNLSKNYGSLEKKSNITLIPKKNYEKENQIPTSAVQNTIPLNNELVSVIKQLCCECKNKKTIKKAEIVLQRFKHEKSQPSKQQSDLIKKIQQLYIQKNKVKKQKKNLEEKVKQLKERQESQGFIALQRENQKLHKFILKQSEIINQQAAETFQVREDLQRVVYSQAKSIQNSLLLKF